MASYSMYRGDYRVLTATVAAPYSATAQIYFAVKDPGVADAVDPTDSAAVFVVTVPGNQSTDNGNGTCTFPIVILPSLTANALPGDYEGQCRYVDANGHPTSYAPFDFVLETDLNQRS